MPLLALVPTDADAFADFMSTLRARPLDVLMAEHNTWMMRTLPLEIEPPSDRRSPVIERFRALVWLTNPHESELSAVRIAGHGVG